MPIIKIESRDNPQLKHVRKVRDGREPELIYLEGLRLAEEALRSPLKIEQCFHASSFSNTDRKRDLTTSLSQQCDDLFELPDRLFSSIADTKTAQGIVLLCRRPLADQQTFDQRVILNGQTLPLVVMLTEVNNPANLGAVIRTAEAAGAVGLIVTNNSADTFSAKALRSAMGSAFRLPIWERADMDVALEWARKRKLATSAATAEGDADYTAVDWTRPSLIVFGSEAHGLGREVIEQAGTTVRIPINQDVESLNLAVSAGVILFEAWRQNAERRKRAG